MFTHPTAYELVMHVERESHLLAFERARRSGVVEYGYPPRHGWRRRAAAVLLSLAARLDRATAEHVLCPAHA